MKMQSDIKACNKHAGPPCPFSCPLHVLTVVDFTFLLTRFSMMLGIYIYICCSLKHFE